MRKAGFLPGAVDGVVVDVNDPPALVRQKSHHIEAVIDRVVVREGVRNRLAESINLAVRHGDGLVLASHEEKRSAGQAVWHDELFSTQYACPDCKIGYEELEPRTLQFQQPLRRLPGVRRAWARGSLSTRNLILPNLELSLADGAIVPWKDAAAAAAAEAEACACGTGWRRPACRWNTPLAKLKPKTLAQSAARRRRRVPRRVGCCWKRNMPRLQRVEAAAAGGPARRGDLPGVQGRPAAARGPQRSASPARRSTK